MMCPMTVSRILGFCQKCFRVRWLAHVEIVDHKGNSLGTCTQCAREEEDADVLEEARRALAAGYEALGGWRGILRGKAQ